MNLTILSRRSPLAKLQVDEALPRLQTAFPEAGFEIRDCLSVGDTDLKTPLTDPSIPSDFFTRELDRAQLAGEADLVVHSAKDLPVPLPEGLVVAAMLPAQDTRDALVVRAGADLTQGGTVGTSSPTREAEIRKVFPGITCKSIRGTIGQRLDQLDAGDYDAVIIAGCALHRLGLADRISHWLDYETTPLQGRLAITVRSDRQDLRDALARIDVRRTSGLVALVGCPADARLLGEHARTLLAEADVVLHDRLIPDAVKNSLGDRGEYVGKKGHSHSTTQAHIHRRILHESEAGKLVVRLHGGEPGILGHLGETLSYCHAWDLRTEVVPAISAAQLAAARTRTSLTHRHHGRSITFLSGHDPENLPLQGFSAGDSGNLAIYMGVRDAAIIQRRLQEAGWPGDTPVTVGQDLGQPSEQHLFTHLDELSDQPLRSPAVFLVGPDSLPDPGTTLFTGTDPRKFLRHGPLLHVPFIELAPLPLPERAAALQTGLSTWDGIIFPSSFAVDMVMEALLTFGDARTLAGKSLIAVGPLSAKALETHGLRADAAPDGFGGAAALAGLDIPAGTYGYLCSDASPVQDRQDALASTGIQLDPVIFYRNQAIRPPQLPRVPFTRVLFTAGSTVRNYFEAFPEETSADREWLAVGTSTLQALEALGLPGRILN